jgi:hypothetical protein
MMNPTAIVSSESKVSIFLEKIFFSGVRLSYFDKILSTKIQDKILYMCVSVAKSTDFFAHKTARNKRF